MIRLQDTRLQALVEQMTKGAEKLSESDVNTLIDAAFQEDGTLSAGEQASLQTLLEEHANIFESDTARARLGVFQDINHTGLRDAAHRFAQDGKISASEALELQDIALESGTLSQPTKLSLKALMGFYSPELEPGAQDLLSNLASTGGSSISEAAKVALDGLGDGAITLSALEQMEAQLAQEYGPEEAEEIMIEALGQDPMRIEFEAIDYLQGKIGSMEGHVDRYQQVLGHHLKDAKILDANFDGKLDENDLVFSRGADGQVNVEKIGKAMSDRVVIGGAMIDAAHDMGKAKHRFGDLEANPVVWEIDEDDPNVMHLNPEFSPSVALMDIFNNPKLYKFECATAMVILRYKAMHDLIGPKDFDRICEDLRIGVWDQEDDAAAIWDVSGKSNGGEDVDITDETKAKIMPGDYSYFKNWDVTEAAFKGGWQGENVIFLGEGKYYGHPFGITEGTKIVEYLNKHRKAGSDRSASLLDLHARVHPDVLKYNEDPTE